MKRWKIVAVLALVFFAGFAMGVVGTRIATRRILRAAFMHPDLVRERIQRDLVRRLRLTAEQQVQVHEVLFESQQQLSALRQEFQPQFATIMSNSQARISAILTPEQRERFEKLRRENYRILQPFPLPSASHSGASNP